MDSDVPHKLLHCVVFKVTVPTVHLKSLVADLLNTSRQKRSFNVVNFMLFNQILLIFLSTAHIKALVRGEELGHGADGNSIGAVLLQRLRCFTYQKARRNQLGGHFCQFELKKLQYEERGGGG